MADLENLAEAVVSWENGVLSRQYEDGRSEEIFNTTGEEIPDNALRRYLSVNPSKIAHYKLNKSKNPRLAYAVLNAINYGGEDVRKLPYGQKREIVEAIYENFKEADGEEARKIRGYCERCLRGLDRRTKYRHPESIALGTMERTNQHLEGIERRKAEEYEDEDSLYEMAESYENKEDLYELAEG